MTKTETSSFVQLPHKLQEKAGIKPKDILVYCALRSYMNNVKRTAFPSHETIAKMLGMDRSTVGTIVRRLLKAGAITDSSSSTGKRNRKGKPLATYHFPTEKRGEHFEPVSKALLLNKQLPWEVKAYIVAALRYMLKQQDGYGTMRLSVSQIAARLHVSSSAVNTYHEQLFKLGLYLYDHDDRLFMLEEMGQNPKLEARKQPTETERMLMKEVEELQQQVAQLRRQNADQDATIDHTGLLMAGVKGIPNRGLVRHLLEKESKRRQSDDSGNAFVMSS